MTEIELKAREYELKEERKRELNRGIASKRDWLADERLRSRRAHLSPHEALLASMERRLVVTERELVEMNRQLKALARAA